MTRLMTALLVVIGCAFHPSRAEATSIKCPTVGTYNRQATFDSASVCFAIGSVTGTPQDDDVAALFGNTWFKEGELTGNGTNDLLTGVLTTGSWGVIPVGGNWAINPSFWGTWGRAVVTFHLGNGGGNPDWFFFEVTPGATSGTFQIDKLSGTGGGLSNMVLWGSGDPQVQTFCTTGSCVATPEPGSMVMLGTGLLIAAALIRRRSSKRTD